MKPHNYKQGIITLICVLSFGAFVFLNSTPIGKNVGKSIGVNPVKIEKEVESEEDQRDFKQGERSFLPDVEAAKQVLQLMKKFLPAS